MNLTKQLATQFREQQLNGNWVATNLKTQLEDVTWTQATAKIGNHNTIAMLAFHINYYVAGVLNVLKGGSLDIRDKYSFNMPPIESQADWENLKNKIYGDAELFADQVEAMPDETLWKDFVDRKYGNYYRNIMVIIEHSYYHLGQIALLKKLVPSSV
jgi:hypothetical protein